MPSIRVIHDLARRSWATLVAAWVMASLSVCHGAVPGPPALPTLASPPLPGTGGGGSTDPDPEETGESPEDDSQQWSVTERARYLGAFQVRGWGVSSTDQVQGGSFSLGQVVDAPQVDAEAADRAGFAVLLRLNQQGDTAVGEAPAAPVLYEAELPGAGPVVLEAANEQAVHDFLDTVQTVGIACGEFHTLLLKRDGTVRAFGWNRAGQTDVPAGLSNVVAIAAGVDHSLAILAEGRAVAWGRSDTGQTEIPEAINHDVVAAAGGLYHSLLLRRDGTVETLNDAYRPEQTLGRSVTRVVAVAAGATHSLALTLGREVIAWGPRQSAALRVPAAATNVVAIAAGGYLSLALRADGRVLAWGDNRHGQLNVPAGATNVVAISAGSYHALALRADGKVIAWGDNSQGQTSVPEALSKVSAIAAGGYHNQVLVRTLPVLTCPRWSASGLVTDVNLPAGSPYRLEMSGDFRRWRKVAAGVAAPGRWVAICPSGADEPFRVYRVIPLWDAFPVSLTATEP